MDGALRQAQAQPLVDVAPTLGGGAGAAPVLPEINLIDVAPVDPPSSSLGVVDPGPGPASARLFWKSRMPPRWRNRRPSARCPTMTSTPRPTALEAYLQDADAAARTPREPLPGGHLQSSSTSPGGKAPEGAATAPGCGDAGGESGQGAAGALPRPPDRLPRRAAEEAARQAGAGAAQVATDSRDTAPKAIRAASSASGTVVAKAANGPSSAITPADPAPVPAPGPDNSTEPSQEYLRQQAFIRQEQMVRSQAGLRQLHYGATPRRSRAGSRGRWRSNAGPPMQRHWLRPSTESRPPFGGVASGSQAAPEVTPTPAVQRRQGPAGGEPEVTTPAPGSGSLPASAPTPSRSTPASCSASSLPAASSTSTPGTSSTVGPSPVARTRRVHKPHPDEANADRAAWRAVGSGWPYGGRQFFRLSAPPPGAAFCRRCFPNGLEGCSEAVESSSGSSSRASGSSPSSHRASSTSESGGSTSES